VEVDLMVYSTYTVSWYERERVDAPGTYKMIAAPSLMEAQMLASRYTRGTHGHVAKGSYFESWANGRQTSSGQTLVLDYEDRRPDARPDPNEEHWVT
jgi:hypothetical protein